MIYGHPEEAFRQVWDRSGRLPGGDGAWVAA